MTSRYATLVGRLLLCSIAMVLLAGALTDGCHCSAAPTGGATQTISVTPAVAVADIAPCATAPHTAAACEHACPAAVAGVATATAGVAARSGKTAIPAGAAAAPARARGTGARPCLHRLGVLRT